MCVADSEPCLPQSLAPVWVLALLPLAREPLAAVDAGNLPLELMSKSQGRESRGTLSEFLRNEKLDSRKFFDLNQNDPIAGEELPGTARGGLKRNQFAGAEPQSSVLPENATRGSFFRFLVKLIRPRMS